MFLCYIFKLSDTVVTQESIEVGAVNIDFTVYLREWDVALVAVVLPCLWRDTE